MPIGAATAVGERRTASQRRDFKVSFTRTAEGGVSGEGRRSVLVFLNLADVMLGVKV